jgi:hypothetical protein
MRREPYRRGWSEQVAWRSLVAKPWPSGAQPEQPSSWQERWKSPHPALWPSQPAASRPSCGHQQAASPSSGRRGGTGAWQVCGASSAGSGSRPRRSRSSASSLPRDPEDRGTCQPARHRLNLLADSKFDEEESSVGPVCFGPHIRNKPFLAKFALPRDMPKYTGR